MSLSGPPVGYLLVFVPIFSHCGHQLFRRGSNVRYTHLIEPILSFLTVFIMSQSDVLKKLWYVKVIGYKVQNISPMA